MPTTRHPLTRFITVCQMNSRQPRPTHDRASYEYLRRRMRIRRASALKHGYRDWDVMWYEVGLGIVPVDSRVVRRIYYPSRAKMPYAVMITGPCGVLP